MNAARFGAAVVLAAWVGACAAPPPSVPRQDTATSAAPVPSRPAVVAPRIQSPAPAPAPKPATPAPAPPVASLPPAPLPDPAELLGWSADAVTAHLGIPGFERRDDPARLWRYIGAACFLDLFLYRGEADGTYRVDHIAVRGRDGGTVGSEKECYRSFLPGGRPDLG